MPSHAHLLVAMLAVGFVAGSQTTSACAEADRFEINQRLGRGINLGNMLDAPTEGAWGHVIEASFFPTIAEAGFDSVRIPVRWSAHLADEAPFTIDPEFFDRVQWAVDAALAEGLAVVLNVHHFDPLYEDPEGHGPRLHAIWAQVGERFADYPETLVFEMLNEPRSALDGPAWNTMLGEVFATIRTTNPTRAVVVGPSPWNGIDGLESLRLPDDDHLIVTVHYYNPFMFTHQGAEWVSSLNSDAWLGTEWTDSDAERAAVQKDFDTVAEWAEERDVPVYVGEYGAYSKADLASRVRWTRYVREQAEARGFSTAYWEFCAGFGAYDKQAKQWRQPLLDALGVDAAND